VLEFYENQPFENENENEKEHDVRCTNQDTAEE
jgi:hypothetical protein